MYALKVGELFRIPQSHSHLKCFTVFLLWICSHIGPLLRKAAIQAARRPRFGTPGASHSLPPEPGQVTWVFLRSAMGMQLPPDEVWSGGVFVYRTSSCSLWEGPHSSWFALWRLQVHHQFSNPKTELRLKSLLHILWNIYFAIFYFIF